MQHTEPNAPAVGDQASLPAPEVTGVAEVVFTPEQQAKLNQIVGAARREGKEEGARPYSDYAQLKADSDKLHAAERAQMSAMERLEETTAEAVVARQTAEAQLQQGMVQAEVRVQAHRLGVIDPDVAAQLLDRSGISWTAAGGPVGVEEALTQLLAEKPYLKGSVAMGTGDLQPGGGPTVVTPGLTADQREAAHWIYRDSSREEAEERYARGLLQGSS